MTKLRSQAFHQLVKGLKEKGKRIAVVESCCGGLINASIMSVPGSSAVYYGGSVAYNTRKSKPLLLNDAALHDSLVGIPEGSPDESESAKYIRSKLNWTEKTAVAFCKELGTDYAIAEGGASGPTFRPKGMDKGFAVIAVAGRDDNGNVKVLSQRVVQSTHNDREGNMRLFADNAARLAAETIGVVNDANAGERTSATPDPPKRKAFDRATMLRTDEAKLDELQNQTDAKYVVLRNATECLFDASTQSQKIAYMSSAQVPDDAPKTFLGIDHEKSPVFSLDLPKEFDENDFANLPPTGGGGVQFSNTRTHAPLLSQGENELALYATAMANWKKTHKFCSGCGQPLFAVDGGTCLQCSSCGAKSWPRQDPSIIVLITNRTQDKALLARSARHPRKVHTALAGFVEAGEAFEDAVVRESFEETGVDVDWTSIQYVASQPWPFPRSTMIGFRATADENLPLCIDENELVSASWFDKSVVEKAATVRGAVMNKDVAEQALQADASLQLLVPPTGVLARTLIDNWLQDA